MKRKQFINKHIAKKIVWFILLSFPILLFLFPFAKDSKGILMGDWDYFAQLYEAARRTILEFHQFPWWNPWIGGGVPLYPNPQYGLISFQTPLVLIFGTLVGLRLSIVLYFIVGFWGMWKLLLRTGANKCTATLLSYIWVFSSFPVWHLAGGQLTFGTYFLAPWFFYFLLNIRKTRGWIWFGLFTAFMLNQSLHYMTVHILVIGVAVVMYQVITARKDNKLSFGNIFKPYLFSIAIALPLAAHKLYFTLQYLHDFPRVPPIELQVPINMITAALTFRGTQVLNPITFYKGGFGWAEYAAYAGLLTLGLFAYLVISNLQMKKRMDSKLILLLLGMALTLLLALGDFSIFSPYNIMKQLPVFNQMQVSARWLGWFIFGMIIFLGSLPKKKIITLILIISAVDVFLSSFSVINYNVGQYNPPIIKETEFKQVAFYKNTPTISLSSLRLFHATQSNIGDIYGYEPLVGFGGDVNEGYAGLSNRCASNRTLCPFVLSNNATVTYWSPGLIKLIRTAPGDIVINENPGAYWKVNGERVFKQMEVTELKENFIIQNPDNRITLQIDPLFLYKF